MHSSCQVLQRKTEEASMATKRLKELLESRKASSRGFGMESSTSFFSFFLFYLYISLLTFFPFLQVMEITMALEFRYELVNLKDMSICVYTWFAFWVEDLYYSLLSRSIWQETTLMVKLTIFKINKSYSVFKYKQIDCNHNKLHRIFY